MERRRGEKALFGTTENKEELWGAVDEGGGNMLQMPRACFILTQCLIAGESEGISEWSLPYVGADKFVAVSVLWPKAKGLIVEI